MLRIGPSGNSIDFYATGRKRTYQEPQWLSGLGLTVFEYSFGQGVKIQEESATKIKEEFQKYNIEISGHAPYYINFANPDSEMIEKSIGYITSSLLAIHAMGGKRVVFHPASCGKVNRAEAFNVAKENIKLLMERVRKEINFEFILCPETMGKMQQIGRVEEIVEICKMDDLLYPCFDFGHINSYSQGGIKTKDDYKNIIDYTINELGFEKASNMHIHFSKIMFGKGGEVKHLTFEDETYGPDYQPLAEIIDEYNLNPYIICESSGTMSRDAITMKNMHKNG